MKLKQNSFKRVLTLSYETVLFQFNFAARTGLDTTQYFGWRFSQNSITKASLDRRWECVGRTVSVSESNLIETGTSDSDSTSWLCGPSLRQGFQTSF